MNVTNNPDLPAMPYFDIADWQKCGIFTTSKQVKTIGNFSLPDKILKSPCPFYKGKIVGDTHFLFAGLDTITIMELRKFNPKEKKPCFHSYVPLTWFKLQKFATKTTLALRWYLSLIGVIPGSENKTFAEQKAMLPPGYKVPTAVEQCAIDILLYKKIGVYANLNSYANTASFDENNRIIRVGYCVSGGVVVRPQWDNINDYTGVGAIRKF